MPNLDGTGPQGQGPKTGRQMGNCEGAKPIGRGFGPCGRGFARGFGRGFRFQQPINLSKKEEKKILEAEKKEIEKRLKGLK